ncbi:MAG TPA: sugar phosphate nucleotidyltransferase [Spirochaetota bacterium]|nr:NTP transferase domain-containing protein [Spirochaetota bacterium]HOD15459.1 sugar phosphate nucleotidyltransferase [Spirochaetota bacterium]HPG52626.1 sugar phosphate nucleotidyltransferase [Spirochaetota bacterium]HPN13708.1 sugar phosphate nucleotidyltransferase [Spirochaetota bacterium]HQL83236.1 sugar phosphate nucleotidyltransferase [Spirochaetota bacterium]
MKAFLLAAGYGERLRPITDSLPKPLVPVMNVPSVCYALMLLKEAGITDVVCNLHHLPDRIESFFRAHAAFGMNITFSREPVILGTGGGLANCRRELGGEPFAYINSDIIADIDIGMLSKALDAAGAGGALAVRRTAPGSGRVAVSGGRAVNLRNILPGTPLPDHDFLGVAVLSPAIFDHLAGGYSDIVETGLIALAREGALAIREFGGMWYDIGTMESYRAANVGLVDMNEAYAERVRAATGMMPSAVSPGATLGPGALARRSVIGDGCMIGDGAVVEESVLLPGVRVAPGGSVTREVRWP